jgi:hypothetical protein
MLSTGTGLLCFFLLFSSVLTAQFSLYPDSSQTGPLPLIHGVDTAGFTAGEKAKLNHFRNQPGTISTFPVKINDLPVDIPDNLIYFQLPVLTPGQPPNCPFQVNDFAAKGSYLYRRSDTEYLWWGAVTNLTRHDTAFFGPQDGYFGMISDSVGKFAFVHDQGRVLYLHTLSERYNLLTEVSGFGGLEGHPPIDSAYLGPPDLVCDNDQNCSAIVSVLVLVTPEAVNWLGDNTSNWLESILFVHLGLQSANVALTNSGVRNKALRYTIRPYNFSFTGSDDIFSDVNNLKILSKGLRESAGCDLLLLLSDDRYIQAGLVASEGKLGLPTFGIVEINNFLTPRFTFAHEAAHCLGAQHNRVDNGGDQSVADPDCKYGYRFDFSGAKDDRTIMALLYPEEEDLNFRRVLHFSNPNISYRGLPTGTQSDYNARVIDQTMCEVKDNVETEELSIAIDGPDIINPCSNGAVYTALINPPGPGIPGGPPFHTLGELTPDRKMQITTAR